MTQAIPTAFVALLSMISSNVAGYTKKTTVAALYLIGYCVGNIIGMFLYLISALSLFIALTIPIQALKPSARRMPLSTSLLKSQFSSVSVYLFSSCFSSTGGTVRRMRARLRFSLDLTMFVLKIKSEFYPCFAPFSAMNSSLIDVDGWISLIARTLISFTRCEVHSK